MNKQKKKSLINTENRLIVAGWAWQRGSQGERVKGVRSRVASGYRTIAGHQAPTGNIEKTL